MLKHNARIDGIRPETLFGIFIAERVFAKLGHEFTVTSVTDSRHGRASLHFVGFAFDIRSRDIPSAERESVRLALQKALGPTFDVVLESDHFHVEFQPKTGLNL